MYFSTLATTSFFLFLARSAALQSQSLSGQATFYNGNLLGGTCSFSTYTLPAGMYGTALSDSNWADAGNCGACISIIGPGGTTIPAMIVDQCPGCGSNHLDLFPDAFATLATPSTGVISVSWSFVDCGITSPLQLHNKEGVSAYWFSMQVVNANKAVSSLEVSTDGGSTWTGTTRQSYNFFEYSSGFGTTTVDVKVTSVDGEIVIVNGVEVASGASTTASSNFGSSGAAAASSPVAAAIDTSTSSPPVATSTQDATPPSQTTDAAGIFEPTFSSADAPVACAAETPTPSDAITATTMATFYAPPPSSTTALAAMSTVTVYVYESCAL